MSSPVLPVLGLALGLSALTFFASRSPASEAEPQAPPNAGGPEGTTGRADLEEVASAIVDEFVAQSSPARREKLEKLLRERLLRQVSDDSWQILLPVDVEGAPTFDRVDTLCRTLGESYGVAVDVRMVLVRRWPFAVVTVGRPAGADLTSLSAVADGYGGTGSDRYGGIIDLVVNTVVASAVGTVTSMGVQDLVRSMGGERRLARVMRHYRRAEERGDEEKAGKIRRKVTRTASRIKGRRVDWSEVEALVGDGR